MAIHCLNQNELEKTPPLAICTPRPLRSPPGFALGQSLEPRGANCLRGRIFQYIPPFGSVLLQYTPALEKIMSIHCLHSGWIGKYAPLGPQDLPQQGFCTPRPLRLPSGCKIPASANLLILGGPYFPIHPSSRQCIVTVFSFVSKFSGQNVFHFFLLWNLLDSLAARVFLLATIW